MERELALTTQSRCQMLDITAEVERAVAACGVGDGLCVVYSPHTTAGVTVNEHADADVAHDILLWLRRAVPRALPGFRHAEGNSDSHIKAALVGTSATLLIRDGHLALGPWQGIFFCEFDGPRQRRCWVRIEPGSR
jgi:secondary thiamine-phosphate synthase enzyme